MPDLRTTYLGLELANPLVPSASPLSRSLDMARRLEDAGAAALVMYSLFEEAVAAEDAELAQFLHHQDIGHAEATSFRPVPGDYHTTLDDYLEQIARLKEALVIPVIASLNGVSMSGWVDHGRDLESAGADALELNVYHVAADPEESGAEVEARYVDLLTALKDAVRIPITMKISPQFSSVAHMVRRLEQAGADGVALFNRFYQPDIDLETLQVNPVPQLSRSGDVLLTMRWIAILRGRVSLSLAATGGIHTTEDVVKVLLAGADVTHLASALLQNGPEHLALLRRGLSLWLEDHDYHSVAQMKGSLCQRNAPDPSAYERTGYLETLHGYHRALKSWHL